MCVCVSWAARVGSSSSSHYACPPSSERHESGRVSRESESEGVWNGKSDCAGPTRWCTAEEGTERPMNRPDRQATLRHPDTETPSPAQEHTRTDRKTTTSPAHPAGGQAERSRRNEAKQAGIRYTDQHTHQDSLIVRHSLNERWGQGTLCGNHSGSSDRRKRARPVVPIACDDPDSLSLADEPSAPSPGRPDIPPRTPMPPLPFASSGSRRGAPPRGRSGLRDARILGDGGSSTTPTGMPSNRSKRSDCNNRDSA